MIYLAKLIIVFIVCSFFGWVMEVICGLNDQKKFVNRGYLIGPVCPIYGVGGMLFYFVLGSLRDDPILLVICMMILAAVLEYATSYMMERIFKVRYWDYSKQKLNLNGRVCAEAIVLFGILGLFGIDVAFPLLFAFLGSINEILLISIAGVLITLFFLDLIVSTVIVVRHKSSDRTSSGDSTEEMSLYVKGTIMNLLVVDGITWNLPKLKVDFKKILEKNR